ncbi:hypothetical protein KZ813_00105 [Sphingomonas sp. RHCKR7]|uniref:hypothetical protein n=1 Tax=Sphingomonas folli TaxID=2862497 RepID=UPI001CA4DFCC|nr:hypothetical protein [Sphingomonas folli]MBW6525238.1 hypothetical protein [Sphingomonas folli]
MATTQPNTTASDTDRITLYGIPSSLNEREDVLVILFYGYKVHDADVRMPSGRSFIIRREEVISDSPVDDYLRDGEPVHAYDIPLASELIEVVHRPVHLGAEIADLTGGTIGGLLASRIAKPITSADEASPAALQLERTRSLRAQPGKAPAEIAATRCGTLRQSYTWCGVFWVSLDPDGADCDPLETLPA